jgi:hypothetical protein
MSVLSFPRLNFRGTFRTNPCTSNNDDVMPSVVDRDVDTLGATLAGMTDAQIGAYLREQVSMSNSPPSPQDPTPACINFIRAGWNLYGDFTTAFDDTLITSVVYGPALSQRMTTPAQDPLVGQPVQLLGTVTDDPARRGSAMICDLDPTGLVTTQLWVGGLQIGDTTIDHDTRAFQNWLNFASTVGPYGGEQNFVGIGCTWQFTMPVQALPAADTVASSGLRALLAAAGSGGGLAVRFRSYEVQPQLRDEDMAAKFQQGQAVDNPALGYLVGTIGVWLPGEPETETAGRKLTVPYPRPAMAWQSADGQQGGIPASPMPWGSPPAMIGNAVACVQDAPGVISLDLVGTFPKYGFRDPDGPGEATARGFQAPKQMADVGAVELAVVPVTGGPPRTIAAIDYGLDDYSGYDAFGGIVDLTYDATLGSLIESGTLVIQATTAPNPNVPLLEEDTLRVVTDDRTMYLLPGANQAARIKVYDRGGPTTSDTVLYLFEYRDVIAQQSGGSCTGVRPNQTVIQPNLANPPILRTESVTVPAGQGFSDWFPVPVAAVGSGATILAFQTDDSPFGSQAGGAGNAAPAITYVGVPGWSTATYSAIRVYANDDFSDLYAAGPLQWQDVYARALRYYYVLFPAMSRFIPLNYPDMLVAQADLVNARLNTPSDPAFWTTANMPATRTMSPAKVKLIKDFISQQLATRATQSGSA